jgi:hypothetical protein
MSICLSKQGTIPNEAKNGLSRLLMRNIEECLPGCLRGQWDASRFLTSHINHHTYV